MSMWVANGCFFALIKIGCAAWSQSYSLITQFEDKCKRLGQMIAERERVWVKINQFCSRQIANKKSLILVISHAQSRTLHSLRHFSLTSCSPSSLLFCPSFFFFCSAGFMSFDLCCFDWFNFSVIFLLGGFPRLSAYRMSPGVSAGCWYVIWCWHWSPWEKEINGDETWHLVGLWPEQLELPLGGNLKMF